MKKTTHIPAKVLSKAQKAVDEIEDRWYATGLEYQRDEDIDLALREIADKYNVPLKEIKRQVLWQAKIKPKKRHKALFDEFESLGYSVLDFFNMPITQVREIVERKISPSKTELWQLEVGKIKEDIYDLVASGDIDDNIIEAMRNLYDPNELIELIEKHIIQ